MNHWRDKVLLITGGSRGIGLAIVKNAIESGVKVSVLARKVSPELEELIGHENVYLHCGDVSSFDDIQDWLTQTIAKFQRLDIVLNNAGLMYYMDVLHGNYEQMKRMVEVNCLGFVNLLHHALPHLSKSAEPHWINITSDAGKQPFPGLAIYSGTKAFVEFSARAMRQELLNANVKVTNIQPGNVATSLHQSSTDKDAVKSYGTENEGQYLDPNDIAKAVEYAISTPHKVAVNEILIEPLTESI